MYVNCQTPFHDFDFLVMEGLTYIKSLINYWQSNCKYVIYEWIHFGYTNGYILVIPKP